MGKVMTVCLYCIENVDAPVAVVGRTETKRDDEGDFFSGGNNCLRRFEK
ncbi:MAG: hypothetical protein BMS9Abin31_1267 [Gammaproteobacteria bacterium]|nr:MAG: hypothetical protein BMS9Abin31_1267 [Gammaproteobacteria bacterium]